MTATVTDYDLYYWPVPFRGQFVRAILAWSGKTWREHSGDEIESIMQGEVGDMPVPFMGPPMLVDRSSGVALSQMPAIVLYLGETLDRLPGTAALRALTLKILCDANDVIDELTLDGGRQMWTEARWRAFVPRLRRWMSLWEETGRRRGLTEGAGYLLGGTEAGLADVVTWTLWSTVSERFEAIRLLLEEEAPAVAALCGRLSQEPALSAVAAKAREDYGDAWCGGRIEASLRRVILS